MDLFTTNNLVGVVKDLNTPPSFFLDWFFTRTIEDPSEEIHFDTDESKPRITPFVSPLVAGKVVNGRGYTTKTFKPAYAKDKRRWQPNRPLKRAIGEKIGGSMSPEQRSQLLLAQELDDQLAMLTRREEVMASEVLRTGKVTVSGEGFETVVVDFGRHADLTITLAGNDRWSVVHADSDPLTDLENWAATQQLRGGVVPTDYVMAPDAWTAFRARIVARGEAAMLLDYARSGGAELNLGPLAGKVQFKGRVGSFGIWSYNDVYVDDAGADQNLMPSGTVIGTSVQIEGARCYGAIQDEEAGYTATRFFVKSWIEKDPAVRWLLLQSAPLVVPFRPNASLKASVLA